jgi:hypothetical protein
LGRVFDGIETININNLCARDEVTIRIDGDLDTGMAHLIADVG